MYPQDTLSLHQTKVRKNKKDNETDEINIHSSSSKLKVLLRKEEY